MNYTVLTSNTQIYIYLSSSRVNRYEVVIDNSVSHRVSHTAKVTTYDGFHIYTELVEMLELK